MSVRDIVNEVACIAPGSALAALRAERPDIGRHTEGAYRALLEPADPGGLSLAERAGIALAVAEDHDDEPLAAHYGALLTSRGGEPPETERWQAIETQVAIATSAPGKAVRGDIAALRSAGLSEREIVTIAQLVAFVSYQARVLTGLRLLGGAV